jgi:hypothetical protein
MYAIASLHHHEVDDRHRDRDVNGFSLCHIGLSLRE